MSLLLLGVLSSALVLLGPALPEGLRSGADFLRVPECLVQTSGRGRVHRDEARPATTAVALAARGNEAPDTAGIDPAVMQRLADGPFEDAGPSLACRGSAGADLQEQVVTGVR